MVDGNPERSNDFSIAPGTLFRQTPFYVVLRPWARLAFQKIRVLRYRVRLSCEQGDWIAHDKHLPASFHDRCRFPRHLA